MGRIVKKRRDGELFKAEQSGFGETYPVILVGGPAPFLWFAGSSEGGSGNLTGRATLRALAHAILEAYPDEPQRKKSP